ncbi:MAG: hypothetical protein ACRDM2_01735 [Gaiellaceae bacterium]
MRLARPLLKLITVLVIVAAAFGGAVALASTLFEKPPRDAEEFAARIDAASKHAQPPERSSAAERRYVLALNDLCDRTDEAYDDLQRNAAGKARLQRLRAWRQVFARFDREFRALTPPKRDRLDAATIVRLDGSTLALTDGAIAALRAGDEDGYDAKVAATELIDSRFDETMRRLGAPSCTSG